MRAIRTRLKEMDLDWDGPAFAPADPGSKVPETARARDCYAWAIRWTRAQPASSAALLDELNLFQAEASELLEIGKKKD